MKSAKEFLRVQNVAESLALKKSLPRKGGASHSAPESINRILKAP